MSRLVFGLRPVGELLRARNPASVLYHAPLKGTEPLVEAARAARVPVEPRSKEELDALCGGGNHQGVVAVAGSFTYLDPLDLVELARSAGEPALLLVLDCVQDPQNLGALIRSAHILGAHGIVLPRDRAAEVTPAVVRASAGASEHMAIAQCTNLARTLGDLKRAGLWIVGAAVEEGEDPAALDLTGPTAIVLGSEGKGLRPLVLRTCDLRARIPMVGNVASLNVASAGTILLYEALRQRRAKAR